jgi:CRP/FNR family cyclic AMP-dependent transcriptional regulator
MLKSLLAQVPLFEGLGDEALDQILPLVEPVTLPPGLTVFGQDTPTLYFYILTRGEVVIQFKPEDGPALNVTTIQPGGIFGWSAALCRDSYTSAAITRQECQALRIIGRELHRLCQQHPRTGGIILDRLSNEITNRLYNTHDQVMNLLRSRFTASLADLRKGTPNDDRTPQVF